MDNVPNVPATPPATPAPPAATPPATPDAPPAAEAPKADASEKGAPLSDVEKINAPVDKVAADKVKTDTPAEKEVIRKIKLGDTEYDENVLKQMIEKSKGADKKFLDAAKARKEALRFFKLAKENPREFLLRTGHDPKKFSYDEVAKDIKNKLKDPKEVELEEAKKRLEEFEKQDAERKEQAKQAKIQQEAKAMRARFESEIIDALEATPAIPKNGHSVAKIARYIDTVRDRTGVLLSAKEVVSTVEKDLKSELGGIVNGADAEQIIALIGAENAEKIRQYHLKQIKDPLEGGESVDGEGQERPAKKRRWSNSHDFWKSIDKQAKEERGEL